MADKTVVLTASDQTAVPVKYHDNGDSTFSPTGAVTATSTPVASELHLGAVGGSIAAVNASYTRPADATAYAALDAIADSTTVPTVLTFANAARVSGGSGYITGARLLTDQKTNVAQFKLHLFNAAPTAINDNSPYLFLYADRAKYLGFLALGPLATEDSSNSTAAYANDIADRLPFVAAATSLFGLLETLTAFTPASGQNFDIRLMVDQN